MDPRRTTCRSPAALLGRAVEQVGTGSGFQVARITFEILRPVPVAPLQVTAEVLRPGRSVVLSSASLSDDKGVVMGSDSDNDRTLLERSHSGA